MTASVSPLVSDLVRLLGTSKVLSDYPARTAYAVDASIYRINPQAVVLIEQETDLLKVMEYAQGHRIALTARSGGSNLTGNAIGEGVILEFSRLNRILELNREEKWVRVQPGKIYGELNRDLERHGLFFAPDPSSGDVCKIGGMLGNNSAGPHTLKYGATKDNVHELRVILADGRALSVRPCHIEHPDFGRLLGENRGLRELYALLQSNRSLIRQHRIGVSKNSSGYNLFDMVDHLEEGTFDLTKLFIGSEGTLGIITETKLRLRDRPTRTATVLVYFNRLEEVGHAVNSFLTFRPSAMELMDASSLDLIGRGRFGIPPEAAAMLLIEFDEEPIEDKIDRIHETTKIYRLSRPIDVARSDRPHGQEQQEALWRVRKAIYPTLYRYDAKKKPINFVDDVVVPATRLPELIDYLVRYFKGMDIPVAIYGHIGDGNAHINPLMDMKSPEDVAHMAAISNEIHSTVIHRFGGSICGEHGDGRVRGEFLRELYGEEVYGLFMQIKRLFDPDQILNPGVKLTHVPFTTHLDTERLAKPCATCGKCNTVCPVYDITQEESNGARGWFHILTATDFSHEKASRVVEACVNCKSCYAVCPAGIDVSKYVLEKRAERPNRLAGLIFGLQARPWLFESLLKWAGWTQPLWNTSPGRAALEYLTLPVLKALSPSARLSRDIVLPRLATQTLRHRFASFTEEAGGKGTVAYFHGCAANYFRDGVGEAVIRLLQRQGIRPVLPRQHCSGTPIETYGHRELARKHARFNMESLRRFETVVTGCASCTFMLKDYARFCSDEKERAQAAELARRVKHITEFLVETGTRSSNSAPGTPQQTVAYHSSCHLRAAGVTKEPRELLRRISGLRFVEMRDADRCAGGAGTFIVKNYEQSRRIFERKRRAVVESGADVIATSCPACMIQLKTGMHDSLPIKHIAQILDEAQERASGPKAPDAPSEDL
ncbi:MAG TPA: FAD-binding and (Fe-S)-binding domain-containing protein [Nitrospiria bacterium]|jgi:FAD/FMN-containing dehydrogenase/Fe-S oxidoreductase|nr:FAD-binding and (Fe-S)-binding domain-containing protein [Nitrospiria bacterium]